MKLKKHLVILWLALLAACAGPAEHGAEISGVIENLSETEIQVLYYTDLLMNTEESVTVPVAPDGGFSALLPLEQGEFLFLRTPRRTISLYAMPGARIHIQFDAENRDEKPVVSGSGYAESAFLIDYNHHIERDLASGLIINRMAGMGAEVFRQYADSVYALKLGHLHAYDGLGELNDDFVAVMETNIMYEKYRLLLEYPLYYAYFNQTAVDPDLPDWYFDFLEEAAAFTREDFRENMRSRAYVSFLSSYLNHLVENLPEELMEGKSYFQIQYAVGKEHFTGVSREFVLAQTLISALHFDEFDHASAMYEDFLHTVGPGVYRRLVADEFRVVQSLTPGNLAPDFTARDINGDLISLSDYRGQVIYLDFWASWCGPCMREMPHAKELKRVMANQHDLVFMYISIDTDEEAWRRTVELHEIEGVHINFPGTATGAPALYHVRGVPTFYIIGRDGRIFDNRPPRPSNPDILSTLMAALLE